MTRKTSTFFCTFILATSGCGANSRQPTDTLVDCSVLDTYEFYGNITMAKVGIDPGWYKYSDPTPGCADKTVMQVVPDAPDRCGDTEALKLSASGCNFWGAGFADWAHNDLGKQANGTGYDGISFWARSQGATEKTFLLLVDDGRTIVATRAKPDAAGLLSAASASEDMNGDGILNAGDVASGTYCTVPPVQALCDPACYAGGVQQPAAVSCVPAANQCGNQFHKFITTTEVWQQFRIPWSELVQWPCPNRLVGGIDKADIRKFEIKFRQGTNYELYLDNIEFYRRRADAGI